MIFLVMSIAAVVIFVALPLAGTAHAVLAWRRDDKRRALVVGALVALVLAVGVDAFFVEPRALEVTHLEIETDKLDAPLTVAVLADVQTDHPGDYEAAVFAMVAAEQPDLILFPGDFVQVRPSEFSHQSYEFNKLLRAAAFDPPLGAFAVPGNIEAEQPERWPESFEGTGVETWRSRTRADLGPLVLTGLPLGDSFDAALTLPPEDPERFHIVFGHAPDFSLGEVGGDLLVAGHTHGGQVQLPFIGPLITFSRVPRDHAAGHTVLDDGRSLVVSRGVGMERAAAPRLRFLCRPELVFIHLVPKK
ncbi:hypothetical protein PPSIR1_20759 [Plesiocystis pacifica SIR-1]|uniref:Calcineurin-like phosphoesterase domain-containing protein n=1 Tax=Plesiocystis pacifica SIR-1 TaxID=391625 RepID=A6GGR7_9BACT|nr:metallophosphoesterase [Plesiocystis pacifica]EDM74914.1 hypothetical protein PPSIR1_20759 [Plesiocystis pacifica SIR-1]